MHISRVYWTNSDKLKVKSLDQLLSFMLPDKYLFSKCNISYNHSLPYQNWRVTWDVCIYYPWGFLSYPNVTNPFLISFVSKLVKVEGAILDPLALNVIGVIPN